MTTDIDPCTKPVITYTLDNVVANSIVYTSPLLPVYITYFDTLGLTLSIYTNNHTYVGGPFEVNIIGSITNLNLVTSTVTLTLNLYINNITLSNNSAPYFLKALTNQAFTL